MTHRLISAARGLGSAKEINHYSPCSGSDHGCAHSEPGSPHAGSDAVALGGRLPWLHVIAKEAKAQAMKGLRSHGCQWEWSTGR